jgi:hypothetical protein
MLTARLLLFSAVRSTDSALNTAASPSDELLGYFQPSANAD